ncbi:ATP-dependent zinc protease [Methyloligella sp. 2.7D]|uniref:ATP-dependent zinc protease family protein n=1 Tax=unclassified Methyloligella TaxID=2625955 RepID=UPI00157DA4A6|nr:ATP-dependent zinc protease [Methyloligella sp. GL2]QKP78015.1 ATP-dependent zinc protease [Methyloligella sp. GL2]
MGRSSRQSDVSAKEPVLHIGWREWIALPELGIPAIKAKIDTGARTSSLHAWNIEPFRRRGVLWLRFDVHPLQRSQAKTIRCEAPAVDKRNVRNSGGHVEERHVIETSLRLGTYAQKIELTLTDRDQMGFRMLLGRTALQDGILIDPARSFLVSTNRPPIRRKSAAKSVL